MPATEIAKPGSLGASWLRSSQSRDLLRDAEDIALVGDRGDAAVAQYAHIAHAAFDLGKDGLVHGDSVAIEFEAAHLFIDQRTQQ